MNRVTLQKHLVPLKFHPVSIVCDMFSCLTKLDANGYRQEESIPYTMNIFSLDG